MRKVNRASLCIFAYNIVSHLHCTFVESSCGALIKIERIPIGTAGNKEGIASIGRTCCRECISG
jgi:hypothetical protein